MSQLLTPIGPHPISRLAVVLLAVVVLACSGCSRATTPTPENAFRTSPPPLISDDLDLQSLADAIDSQRAVLNKKPLKMMRFGPYQISQGAYANALDQLAIKLRGNASTEEKLSFIETHFDFFEIYGGDSWGEVLLTSYFEPVIPGSLKRTPRFNQPLYGKPADLLSVPLSPFGSRFKDESALRGRVDGNRVVPYYSREEIDGKGALRARGLELCWVDPIDAFFLHIQGSGTVQVSTKTELHLTYADKNGLAYVPIGKFLKDTFAPQPVTMQRIVEKLQTMSPAQRNALLFKNPSYVFFQRSAQRAITSLGVPATPGRTIAADPTFAPKGALAFIAFSKPEFRASADSSPSSIEVGRFVLDQDSGGAITGTGRIDLFWGRGDEAKRFAGVLQDSANVWYLVPKATQ